MFESPSGLETPIIFPEWIAHSDIAQVTINPKVKLLSAGFCYVTTNSRDEAIVYAQGESISLRIKSRKEDSEILNTMFNRRM